MQTLQLTHMYMHTRDICSLLQLHEKGGDGPLVRLVNYGCHRWSADGQVYKDYLWSIVDGDEVAHQPMIPRPSGAPPHQLRYPTPAAVPSSGLA